MISLSSILLLTGEVAHHATEAAAHAEHVKPAFLSWQHIVESNVLNIGLVAALIVFVIIKSNVGGAIKGKQQRVIEDIDAAEVRQKEAKAKLDELVTRASGIEQEVTQILSDAKSTAERLKQSIIEDAESQAAKIRENALKRLALEEKQRLAQTQERLMNEAIVAAKALLENTLSDDDRLKSVEDFISQLPKQKESVGGKAS